VSTKRQVKPLRYHCSEREYEKASLEQKRGWNGRFLGRVFEGKERTASHQKRREAAMP
jgi:hypothetical protein